MLGSSGEGLNEPKSKQIRMTSFNEPTAPPLVLEINSSINNSL